VSFIPNANRGAGAGGSRCRNTGRRVRQAWFRPGAGALTANNVGQASATLRSHFSGTLRRGSRLLVRMGARGGRLASTRERGHTRAARRSHPPRQLHEPGAGQVHAAGPGGQPPRPDRARGPGIHPRDRAIPARGWYLNIHQGNSGNILSNGQPTIYFRPLLCADIRHGGGGALLYR